MKNIISMLIVFFLFLPTISFASLTGSTLLKNCNIALKILDADSDKIDSDSSLALGLCLGYINGIDDMHFFSAATAAKMPDPSKDKNYESEIKQYYVYCASDNVTEMQQIGIVVKYLKNHPEFLDVPPAFIVVKAFKIAFPCKQPKIKN